MFHTFAGKILKSSYFWLLENPGCYNHPCPDSSHALWPNDITLKKENLLAMDKLKTSTLELEMNDFTNEHESPCFEFPRISC
jgi:hypothetical protein